LAIGYFNMTTDLTYGKNSFSNAVLSGYWRPWHSQFVPSDSPVEQRFR